MQNKTLQTKRVLRTALLVLLLSVVGMGKSYAQTTFTVGDLNYSVNSDGATVTVTGHVEGMSAAGTLNIPDVVTYEGMEYSVTVIGRNAFSRCSGLTGNLVIPNSVRTIDYGAFSDCTGFTGNLIIPNSVLSIGGFAFACVGGADNEMGFTGELVIGNSVTSIGEYAFHRCYGITSFNIPESVAAIETAAFLNTGWYETQPVGIIYKDYWYFGFKNHQYQSGPLILEEGAKGIAGSAFQSSSLISSVIIPNSIVYIGDNAFAYCYGLSGSLNIPDSVKEIGDYAFYKCLNFDGLLLGNSLERIGKGAFSMCEGFTGELVLPNSLTTLEDFSFFGCTGFTGDLVIPNSLTTIREGTFSNFGGGSMGFNGNLFIPSSVDKIYDQAFCCCDSLKSITVCCSTPPECIKLWPDEIEDVFYGVNKDIPVYVQCDMANEYQSADYWDQFNNFVEVLLYNFTIEAIDPEHCSVSVIQQPSCTEQAVVQAIPIEGYRFVAWEENGEIVSTDSVYTFTVARDMHLLAKVIPNTGISESLNAVVNAYPNPATDVIHIEAENLKHITINNTFGQIIYDGNTSGNSFEYDFSKFGAGLYLIRIETASGIALKKVSVVQ